MWRVLRPGGAAIINVAAMEILRGNHSVLSAELRRYSRGQPARTLLERAGFRVERMTYTNAALFPVMLTVRGVQRLMGLAPESEAEGEITVPACARQRGARRAARGRGGRRAGRADALRQFAALPG